MCYVVDTVHLVCSKICCVVDKVHLVGSSDRFGWDLYKSIECNLIQNSNLLILPTIQRNLQPDSIASASHGATWLFVDYATRQDSHNPPHAKISHQASSDSFTSRLPRLPRPGLSKGGLVFLQAPFRLDDNRGYNLGSHDYPCTHTAFHNPH
jgi:hypothetical protein